nr:MAG TPA: hypothetical protein [Bacteriophage sp.]
MTHAYSNSFYCTFIAHTFANCLNSSKHASASA